MSTYLALREEGGYLIDFCREKTREQFKRLNSEDKKSIQPLLDVEDLLECL